MVTASIVIAFRAWLAGTNLAALAARVLSAASVLAIVFGLGCAYGTHLANKSKQIAALKAQLAASQRADVLRRAGAKIEEPAARAAAIIEENNEKIYRELFADAPASPDVFDRAFLERLRRLR